MMKKLFVFCSLLGAMPSLIAVAHAQDAAQTDTETPPTARAEIQTATDDLNAALLRGDAAGALKWLAPDFELGERQYRVRDLAWMQQALPLQLERVRFTKLSAQISGVKQTGGVASAEEVILARASVKDPKQGGQLNESGIQGSGRSQWIKTANGWRLRRGDDTLNVMLFWVAPPAPIAAPMPVVAPDSPAAVLGLPLQEPAMVLEKRDIFGGDSLAFSPDSRALASSYDEGAIRVVSIQTGAATTIAVRDMVHAMAYAADGSFWTAQNDGKVRRWNAAKGTVEREWTVAPQYQFYRFGVAPDGRTFAVGDDKKVQLWDADGNRVIQAFTPAFRDFMRIEFSPDSAMFAIVSYNNTEVRDARTGAALQGFENEKWGGFLPGGQTVATMQWSGERFYTPQRKSEGNFLRFRSLEGGTLQREMAIPDPVGASPQELEKARQFHAVPAIGTIEGGVDLAAPVTPISISGYFNLPRPVLAPNGQIAASVYFDGSIGIWNTQSGQIFRVLRGFSSAKIGDRPDLVFSPDSQTLAVSSRNREIAVWDVSAPATP